MTFGGIGLAVIGLVLLALGHRGNTGLPIVAVGALSFAICVVSSLVRRPWSLRRGDTTRLGRRPVSAGRPPRRAA